MKRALFAVVGMAIVSTVRPASAQQGSSDVAREELKQGYELKRNGQCAEAIPHLRESARLDPGIKALANLAECEEKTGKLVVAAKHWEEVRRLASIASNTKIEADARARLAALAARIPTLTLHVAPDAPADVTITLDDAPLSSADRAAPLPLDPGEHVVRATAAGYAPSHVSIELVEGQKGETRVALEPLTGTPTPVEHPQATGRPSTLVDTAPVAAETRSTVPWKTIGFVTGAVGVVGLAFGAGFGVSAMSQKSNDCGVTDAQGNLVCSSASGLHSARTMGDLSTGFFVVGGVLAASGVTLWLVAPGGKSSLQPAVTGMAGGATLGARASW